jgi:hypothetical protein
MLTENTVREHEQARRILPITVSSIPGRKRIAVLRPHGSLCAATYRDLIAEAKKLYDAGVRWFLLDLGETPYIGFSGLVALHNIAVMLQGEEAPDPEYGWQAIHALERGIGGDAEKRLKILKAQPQVAQLLQSPCFARFLDVYTDSDAAVASCRQPCTP